MKRKHGLARAIMTHSRLRWSSVAIHPLHLSQALDELVAEGGTVADLENIGLAVLLPANHQTAAGEARGVMIGGVGNVPRHAVLGLAEADTLNDCLVRTLEALHRLDNDQDTVGTGRLTRQPEVWRSQTGRPGERIWTPPADRRPRPLRPELN